MNILDTNIIITGDLDTEESSVEVLDGDIQTDVIYPYTDSLVINLMSVVIASNSNISMGIIDWSYLLSKPNPDPYYTHVHDDIYYLKSELDTNFLVTVDNTSAVINQTVSGQQALTCNFVQRTTATASNYSPTETSSPILYEHLNYGTPSAPFVVNDFLHVKSCYGYVGPIYADVIERYLSGREIWTNRGFNQKITLSIPSTFASAGYQLIVLAVENYPIIVKTSGTTVPTNHIWNYGGWTNNVVVRPKDGIVNIICMGTYWITDMSANYYRNSLGYITGGLSNVISCIDTTTTSGNALGTSFLRITGRSYGVGVSRKTYGYIIYGLDLSTEEASNTTELLDFTTGSTVFAQGTTYSSILSSAISSTTYGFIGGGQVSGGTTANIVFIPNDGISFFYQNKGTLVTARAGHTSVYGTQYGFFLGGVDDGNYATEYIDVTTTTGNATSTNIAFGHSVGAGVSGLQFGVSGPTYGFFAGGVDGGANLSNTIYRLSVDTTAVTISSTGTLTAARAYLTGISGPVYGYFCGGVDLDSIAYNIVDYIDMTVASSNAIDKGDLSIATYTAAGVYQ